MPAKSEAQRRYLNAEFGHEWVKEHHFDNTGPLPKKKGKKVSHEKHGHAKKKKHTGKISPKHGFKSLGSDKLAHSSHAAMNKAQGTPRGFNAGEHDQYGGPCKDGNCKES
jgi:hypothetical protein